MKKKTTRFRWLLTTLLLVAAIAMPSMVWAAITPSKPANGDGTGSNPYQISNAAELYWFAALVNGTLTDGTAKNAAACAKLTADITVNSGVLNSDGSLNTANSGSFDVWTPIGTDSNDPYAGSFNGDNHTVGGLYVSDSNANYVGLFGCNSGTIQKVGVVDSYLYGGNYVGGVCGYNYALMTSESVEASISRCYNSSVVKGKEYVGGVCGKNEADNSSNSTSLIDCPTASVSKCYNTGTISGYNQSGGVCGCNYATTTNKSALAFASISYCHNSSKVNVYVSTGGNSYVGSICGVNTSNSDSQSLASGGGAAKIDHCYFDSNKSQQPAVAKNSGDVSDVEAKTTAQFKSGEVAYLLQTEMDNAWGQTVGTDDYPVIGGAMVYYIQTKCTGEMVYSNTADHLYINGNCTLCGAYQLKLQPAPKNGDVYEISNADQLYWFAALVNGTLTDGTSQDIAANAKLMADIVVNKNVLNEKGELNHTTFTSWTTIGYFNSLDDFGYYRGTFDGNGHTISGLY